MLIYIVRHGETASNEKGLLQGWSDDPLNDNGRKLAIITGQSLKEIHFDQCFSSPLIRAKETAEIILRNSGNDIPIYYDDRIKEINFGNYEQASIFDKKIMSFFSEPEVDKIYPEGESILQVMDRTQAFLRELIMLNNNKTYLISTHGCALRAMLNCLYDDPSDFWHSHVPYNCSVNIIEANGGEIKLLVEDKVYYDQHLIIDHYNNKVLGS